MALEQVHICPPLAVVVLFCAMIGLGCDHSTSDEQARSRWRSVTTAKINGSTVTYRVPRIVLRSPIVKNGAISSKVACPKGELRMPVSWLSIPPSTTELVLYIALLQDVPNGRGSQRKAAALLIGIPVEVRKLNAGADPRGSYWIENPTGGLCSASSGDELSISLYSLGKRNQIDPGSIDLETLRDLPTVALAAGTFTAVYRPSQNKTEKGNS
jgi:hypothetical protein